MPMKNKNLKPAQIDNAINFLKDNPDIAIVTDRVIDLLGDGKTPMQIEDALYDFELTALQTGIIAHAITKFHKRGTEFRTYWNKRNNAPEGEGLNESEEITIGFPIKKRKNAK